MKTKYVFMALATLMLLGGIVSAQWDGASTFANVSVSPNPVIAGGNATIVFQLYNSYNFPLSSVNLQPTGSYPLLNVSPLNSRQLGPLPPGLNPTYFNYTFPIPATAPSGVYTLTFTATYYTYTASGLVIGSSTMPVSIYVQNKPAIKVIASSSQPAALYAGYNQTVELAIENNGYGDARNVSVTVSAGSGTNLLSSINTFFISNLTRGSAVDYPILVSVEHTGSARIIANVTYYTSNFGQRFSSIQSVNLSVAPSAQFNISAQSSSLSPGSTDVPLKFTITNTGSSDAQDLQLSLETNYPITPVASTAYISDLKAGATTNVTFLVSADSSGVAGNYPVTIFEQWKQPSGAVNQQYSGSTAYYAAVQSSSVSGVYEEWVVGVIGIVIVVVIALRLRARFSKRQHGQKKA